jgi:uncharacterized protein YqgC (DUF456 family)
MDFNVVTLLVSLVVAAGVFFTVFPVLPGSLICIAGLLWWAIAENNSVSWWVFAVCTVLLAAGASMQLLLTGRSMRRNKIPNSSVLIGVVAGLVLMFFIPIAGLALGFAGGLFLMEFARQRDARAAVNSSLAAIKATGWGILAEFGLASVAATIFFAALLFSRQV